MAINFHDLLDSSEIKVNSSKLLSKNVQDALEEIIGLCRPKLNVFYENQQVITENYVLYNNMSASAVGPIYVADGFSITTYDDSRLVIL